MNKNRIMIVDDNAEFLEELEETLSLSGYDPIAINDSAKVYDLACRTNLALILLDLKMDGLDGFQLAENLKQSPQTDDIPLIAMTGFFNEEEYLPLMDRYGMRTCLRKPFYPLDVIKEIEKVLAEAYLYKQIKDLKTARWTEYAKSLFYCHIAGQLKEKGNRNRYYFFAMRSSDNEISIKEKLSSLGVKNFEAENKKRPDFIEPERFSLIGAIDQGLEITHIALKVYKTLVKSSKKDVERERFKNFIKETKDEKKFLRKEKLLLDPAMRIIFSPLLLLNSI